MRGTMMDFPLTLQHLFERGTRLFPNREIVTGGTQGVHRYTYRDFGQLVASGAPHCDFPRLDENEAAMMCYTSGTTGNPKGVAYSHRALTLHSFAVCHADTIAVSERDTVMAMVPMFHANAWGLPYASVFVGAKQVFPGNSMLPERVLALIEKEHVTLAAGVPTIWIGSLP